MMIRYLKNSDDLYKISKIYEESWKFAYQGIIPQDYLDKIGVGSWIGSITSSRRYNLVMIENDEYIGVVSFGQSRSIEFSDMGEIYSIYFLPEYVGKGFGTKLMQAVFKELKKQGYQTIYLWVLDDNISAKQFYEKNGFVRGNGCLNVNIGGKWLKQVQYYCQLY